MAVNQDTSIYEFGQMIKKKFHLQPEPYGMTMLIFFSSAKEQILHGMGMKLKELMSMKNVFSQHIL